MKNAGEILRRFVDSVLLFDGGMGTELYNRGVFINKCFEEVNITNPELVKEIHNDYKNAGADVIQTNTFGANRYKLVKHQLQDKIYEINAQGVKLAKETAGEDILVAGSIGPLGIQIEPLGSVSKDEAMYYFKEHITPIIDAGADLLVIETFTYPEELKQAVAAAKDIANIPTIALMTIDEDTTSLTGASPDIMIKELEETGADAIGINGTVGPKTMLEWLEKVRKLSDLPIAIMPFAGKPHNIDGRNIYLASPEYLGEYARHYINAGANIIGGSSGIGPRHIKKMRAFIDALKPESKAKKFQYQKISAKDISKTFEINPVEKKNKSRLSRRMCDGHFVKFVELLAPKGINASKVIVKAREMHYYGIDVINIPDGPRASARMSAMLMALHIQQQVGIETVLHYVCRDRNVIGIQADLLGAYSLGLKNILAITGDPPKVGNYPDATAVFDVDSIGLVNILNRLNHGMDIAGNPIGEPSGFFVGVGANPAAINLDNELKRLAWKIDAGAEYIITQPVFDLKVYENFIKKTEHYKIPVIAGLWPLTSLKNAKFMNNEIPEVFVPEYIMERLAKYEDDKESSLKEGIAIAREILETIAPYSAGVQISAPFGRVQSVIDLLDGFKY
jgi:methionine synthase I (cobalamin-dependent)/5,10-methylenetetrahydrofolate reductase